METFGSREVSAMELINLAREHLPHLAQSIPSGFVTPSPRQVGIYLRTLLGRPVDLGDHKVMIIKIIRVGRAALYRLEPYVERSAQELHDHLVQKSQG